MSCLFLTVNATDFCPLQEEIKSMHLGLAYLKTLQ